jgi:hypothetical protein
MGERNMEVLTHGIIADLTTRVVEFALLLPVSWAIRELIRLKVEVGILKDRSDRECHKASHGE